MGNEQKQHALQILRRFEQADPMTRQADNAAVDMAALLRELIEQRASVPELKDGEIYAGVITGKDGAKSYHLILLPGDNEANNWQANMEWAKEIGGELPNRREQSLLFTNCKQHFEEDWYWSGEEYSSGAAWSQDFGLGLQTYDHKDDELRVRAVRRLIIED